MPGVTVAAVARRNRVAPSLVFGWRDQARSGHLGVKGTAPMLVPVAILAADAVPVAAPFGRSGHYCAAGARAKKNPRRRAGLMEIELELGRRLKVDRDVDAGALARVDQGAIVESRKQAARRTEELDMARSKKAPRRQGQADRHMFKTG